jgi:Zn-dependent protease with chaperone function
MNPVECLGFALSQPEWQLALGGAAALGLASYAAYARVKGGRARLRLLYASAAGANAFLALSLSTVTCVLFLSYCNTSLMGVAALALPLAGALMLALGYFAGDRLIALAHGAKPLRNALVEAAVQEASKAHPIPAPALYYFDSGEPNVFSTSGRTNALFFSVGALEVLAPDELRAVVAHELEHLRNRDPLKKLAMRLALAPRFLRTLVRDEHEERADRAGALSGAGALRSALSHFTTERG